MRSERMPDEQFGIFIFVTEGTGIPVGQEFMCRFNFFTDQVEKRIEPRKTAEKLQQQNIKTVILPDMVKFMPENLFASRAIPVQFVIPKNHFEKGKWCSRFFSQRNQNSIDPLSRILPG